MAFTHMNSGILTILSVSLGLFFVLMGTLKLTPAFSEEFYRDLRKYFLKIAKVFPLSATFGFKVDGHIYRKIIGTLEVVNGIALAAIPGPLQQIANVFLIAIMGGALYTHIEVKDELEKMTPSIIFSLLLLCRLVIYMQVRAREEARRIDDELRVLRDAKLRELELLQKKHSARSESTKKKSQ